MPGLGEAPVDAATLEAALPFEAPAAAAKMPERGSARRKRDPAEKGKDHRDGHRQRLRERFALAGAEGIGVYELLELILFRAQPRQDMKPLAKALLDRFGSFAEVITASPHRLREIEGVGDAVVSELKIVEAAAQQLIKGSVTKSIMLASWAAVTDYCRAKQAFCEREEFRVLFLNKRNALIRDEVLGTGTVDHTPAYPREIIKRALELTATGLVLVHNHPTRPLKRTFAHAQSR